MLKRKTNLFIYGSLTLLTVVLLNLATVSLVIADSHQKFVPRPGGSSSTSQTADFSFFCPEGMGLLIHNYLPSGDPGRGSNQALVCFSDSVNGPFEAPTRIGSGDSTVSLACSGTGGSTPTLGDSVTVGGGGSLGGPSFSTPSVFCASDDNLAIRSVTGPASGQGTSNVPVELDGDCTNPDVSQDCGIVTIIVTLTRVLAGLVGLVVVIMIAVGGIQYSMARDNPQAVVAARGRIINALLALVFYIFSFAILQWLVPGGIV